MCAPSCWSKCARSSRRCRSLRRPTYGWVTWWATRLAITGTQWVKRPLAMRLGAQLDICLCANHQSDPISFAQILSYLLASVIADAIWHSHLEVDPLRYFRPGLGWRPMRGRDVLGVCCNGQCIHAHTCFATWSLSSPETGRLLTEELFSRVRVFPS